VPNSKRATPPTIPTLPPPPAWVATQRLLAEGQGVVRSRELYRARRWLGADSAKQFGGLVALDIGFVARCTECKKSFAIHGWTGTEYVCPGDWLVQDRKGVLRRFKPGAFLELCVAESSQSPPPRAL
jgi:hypothetical protein